MIFLYSLTKKYKSASKQTSNRTINNTKNSVILRNFFILILLITNTGFVTAGRRVLDAVITFYPGSSFQKHLTMEAPMELVFKGDGNYQVELYIPGATTKTLNFKTTGISKYLSLIVTAPEKTPIALKVYSVNDNHSVSQPIEFVSSQSSIGKCQFLEDKVQLFPANIDKAVKLKAVSPDLVESDELYPKTIFEYYDKRVSASRDTGHVYILSSDCFHKTDTRSSKLISKSINEHFNALSRMGVFCLYHMLGGEACFSMAFFTRGDVLNDVLKAHLHTLSIARGCTPKMIEDSATEIMWLTERELKNNNIIQAGRPLAGSGSGEQPLPVTILHAAYHNTWHLVDDSSRMFFFNKCCCNFLSEVYQVLYAKDGRTRIETCLQDSYWPFPIVTEVKAQLRAQFSKGLPAVYNSAPHATITCSYKVGSPLPESSPSTSTHRTDFKPVSSMTASRPEQHTPKVTSVPAPSPKPLTSRQVITALQESPCFRPEYPPGIDAMAYSAAITLSMGRTDFSQAVGLLGFGLPPFSPSKASSPELCAYNASISIPRRLKEDFIPLESLGAGSEAECYQVKFTEDSTAVPTLSRKHLYVLKLVKNYTPPADPELRQQVLLALGAFNHPCSVKVHQQRVVTTKNPPKRWYAQLQEFCPGGDLESWVEKNGPLSPYQCWAVTVSLLDVLGSWHSRSLVHRDIKPGNILIGDDGHIRVSDFGTGKLIKTDDGMTTSLSGTAVFAGAIYADKFDDAMSKYNPFALDHIALGVTLFNLMTGTHFYSTPDITDPALSLQAQVEYFKYMCKGQPSCYSASSAHLNAARVVQAKLESKFSALRQTAQPHFIDFISKLLCSHLDDSLTSRSLLEYFTHAYILNPPPPPTRARMTSGTSTSGKVEPCIPYCPELMLSDRPEILRPTLMSPLVVSRRNAYTGQDEEFDDNIKQFGLQAQDCYFSQPLPKDHCGWHHAYLMADLIQIIRRVAKKNDRADVFRQAKEKYTALIRRVPMYNQNAVSIKTIMQLITSLEKCPQQRSLTKCLYETLLEGCSLNKASPSFNQAAIELASCVYFAYPAAESHVDKLNSLGGCHIINEDQLLTAQLPVKCEDMILYQYSSENGWAVLIPKSP
ncbi:protein kinase domain-containing protein [Endozoicomonadaceae bacterium StTr2]